MHQRGVFSVARFGLSGQCEGLYIVEPGRIWLHVFYLYAAKPKFTICHGELETGYRYPTMRKFILFVVVCLLAGTSASYAQLTKEQLKERKEIVKASKAQLNDKASKTARKEAKRMKKEGWQIAPGALPIEKQLDNSYLMQYEFDEEMYPKYIMGEAISIGGNYDAAKMQALELAKQNLAGQIQTEVTALIENTVANAQLQGDQAESITRSVLASKNLISQSIGRTIPVIEVYRTLNNNNREVMVRIAYSGDAAKKIAKEAIKKDLEERGDDLHNKLDEFLGWL